MVYFAKWLRWGVALVGWATPSILLHAAEEIPKLRPPAEIVPPTFWELNAWWLVTSGVCIVVGLALIGWWFLRPKPAIVIPPATAARQALAGLRHQPEDFALISRVARILRHYLANFLALPSEELTADELLKQLDAHPVLGADLSAALIDFFRRADAKRFAPSPPATPLNAVEQALQFIEQVESRRPPPLPVAPPESNPLPATPRSA